MKNKTNVLCFTGHRNEKMLQNPEELEELKLKIREEIDKAIENGIDTFYMGACRGFDLLCAEVVLTRKRIIKMSDPKRIKLIAVVPFEEQAIRWRESDRDIYYDTLAQ